MVSIIQAVKKVEVVNQDMEARLSVYNSDILTNAKILKDIHLFKPDVLLAELPDILLDRLKKSEYELEEIGHACLWVDYAIRKGINVNYQNLKATLAKIDAIKEERLYTICTKPNEEHIRDYLLAKGFQLNI